VLELPTDRPRSAIQSYRGSRQEFRLSSDLSKKLRELSRRENVTLFMLLLAAWQTLLSRYNGQADIVVGTDVANRRLPVIEGLIGFFVNQLVLRTDLSGNPRFRELLSRVRDVTLGAYSHQDLPFSRLVDALRPERNLGHNALFQVLFTLQNAPGELLELSSLTWSPLNVESRTTQFDLAFMVIDRERGINGSLSYSTDLFDGETIARMLRHFERLLSEIASNVDQRINDINLLGADEREQLLVARNQTQREYREDKCLAELFEEQVALHAETIAVRDADIELSYDELNCCANRVARTLCAEGVGPEAIVGLMCERSAQFLIGMLGVFKAGGAYLPLAEQQPSGRLQEQLRQSGARVVLVSRQQAGRMQQMLEQWSESPQVLVLEEVLSASGDDENLEVVVGRRNLAYVIYTSGSTGEPKGVMIEQGGMLNHLWAKIEELELRAEDVVAQTAAVSFDISVWQYLAALLVGGRVEVLGEEAKLLHAVSERGVTVLETVPALLRASLDASAAMALPALRWLIVTGEALSSELCVQWLQRFPAIAMVNAYGPTECSDDVTHSFIRNEAESGNGWASLGSAVGNTRLYVLDEAQRVVPIGVRGELYVGGAGVGRGYLKRAEITAEKFVPDPFSAVGGERLYRTGDVVRWRSDGELEFIGRVDEQVKVRGFRIELGEIEVALKEHESISDCVVVAQEDETGKRLVAYVVSEELSNSELRQYLKERLPEYMVPAVFVSLEHLPLTVNGKVDRKALPAAELSAVREEYVGPRNAVEEELCRIWTEVLKVERVGIEDNFFELGGHSLLATIVVASIEEILQVEVKLRTLFENPTVAELAETLLENPDERELIERAAELAAQLNQLSNEEIETLLAQAPA
jgi:amino acid adenylation domain-containing protein